MNIYQSISAIMDDIPAIGKNQKNAQQGFMYRGIDVVMNVLQPLLSKYKVFVVPEVISQIREERQSKSGSNLLYSIVHVKYTFYAEDGSYVTASVIGEGMDSADKATNKAMSVAFKYACFQVFCIPTEEMKDPDAETQPPSLPKEAKAPEPNTDATHFKCADCGKVLKALKDENEKVVSSREWAAKTEKQYGRPLCLACTSIAKAVNRVN